MQPKCLSLSFHFYFSIMFQPKGKEIEKDYKKPCNPVEIPQHPTPLPPSFFSPLLCCSLISPCWESYLLLLNLKATKNLFMFYLHCIFLSSRIYFSRACFQIPGCIPSFMVFSRIYFTESRALLWMCL